jgi:hypothetical protein
MTPRFPIIAAHAKRNDPRFDVPRRIASHPVLAIRQAMADHLMAPQRDYGTLIAALARHGDALEAE